LLKRQLLRGALRSRWERGKILADLVEDQRPFATILDCSDSRVRPELIFDAEFGDLFVIRVAGNVASLMSRLGTVAAHVLGVFVWSLIYLIVDTAPAGTNLAYFAFVNYATLSYGDVIPVEGLRLLGPTVLGTGDAVSQLDWTCNGAERLEAFARAKDRHGAVVEYAPED
jgi:hypothetical protein